MLTLIWWRTCLFESHIRSGLQPGVCPRQGIPAADALSLGHCDPLPCAQRPWPVWHLHPMISSSPPDWQAGLGVAPRQRNAIVMGTAVQMLRVCWLAQNAALLREQHIARTLRKYKTGRRYACILLRCCGCFPQKLVYASHSQGRSKSVPLTILIGTAPCRIILKWKYGTCTVATHSQLARCGSNLFKMSVHPFHSCIAVIYSCWKRMLWCQSAQLFKFTTRSAKILLPTTKVM